MEIVYERVAGIDVGKKILAVAVHAGGASTENSQPHTQGPSHAAAPSPRARTHQV